MREADGEFLPIPSGVDKLLLQVLEELESGDRQELGVWLEPQVLFKRIIHSNCWLKILRASNYVQIYIATLFRTSQHQSCITQFTRIAQLIYILYNQYEQCELHSYIQIVYIHFSPHTSLLFM